MSLYTSDAAAGMLESSTLIAEQAKKAGVTITLDRVPANDYYGDKYLKAAFGCSQWSQKPLDTPDPAVTRFEGAVQRDGLAQRRSSTS